MEIRLFGKQLKIEFAFLITIAFVLLFGFNEALYVILFSSLHEAGHFIALYSCGGQADKLTLSYYGFSLSYSSELSRMKEAIVLLMGPMVNLILWYIMRDEINLILFSLNILPVFPLDGGRILRLYCPEKIFFIISMVILALLMVLSMYLFIQYKVFTLFFIVIYLIISNVRGL